MENHFKKIINHLEEHHTYFPKNQSVYIIYINGKLYKTPKGKSSWRTKGYAKAAFTNHFYYIFRNYLVNLMKEEGTFNPPNNTWTYIKEQWLLFLKYMEKSNILVIVELKQ